MRKPPHVPRRLVHCLALALGGLPALGLAQAQNDGPRSSITLSPVVVHGQQESPFEPVDGYLATRNISATKTNTALIETPQSVSVVTSDEIRDMGADSLQEALNYAAGVRSDAYGLDSRSDNARIRGATPTTYQDGLRSNYNYYTSTTRPEPYTLERIEVLRGPTSMLYGQGSTGGVINLVSKRPLAEPHREIEVSYGTHDRRQIAADLTGPIDADGEWRYRLVAVGRKSDTQVDYVRDDRWVLAPSLTWQPSAATSLTLLALLQNDTSGSTAQFFPWEGVVLPNPNGQLPTDRFIGDPDWDRYNSKRRSIGWSFEHAFNPMWTFRQNARWSRNDVDYRSLYGDAFTLPGGWAGDPVHKRLLGRIAWGSQTSVRMLAADQHLEGRFQTGPITHQMLIGYEITDARESQATAYDAPIYNGGGVPLIDAYAPVYPAYTPPGFNDLPRMTQRDQGLYLQDQLRWNNWIVVAGLRRDRSHNAVDGADSTTHDATTKRLGVMYVADNGLAPYVNYSESFTPVLGRNAAGDAFVPLRGEQFEVGLKYEAPSRDLWVTASAYTLSEKNQLVSDPANPNNSIQVGKTRNRGLDLELKARLGRHLDLLANYSYIDLDDQLEALPKHMAAVWGKYRFAVGDWTGFSVGAGVRYFGAFQDGNAPRTASVTLMDAMLAYDTPSWRFALNANNLFDREYVSTCLSRGDCWYGARRTLVATVGYKF